jgi:TetR/AcrR family transcriptional regulator, cholesterol catabolism regulator
MKQSFRLDRGERKAPPPVRAFGNALDANERLRRILDASAARFETNGFHGTSLQHIADDVGITKAALYHYVSSKEELLFTIHDVFVTSMIESAEAFIAENTDPVERIRFFVQEIFLTVACYRPYVKAFFRDYGVLQGDLQTELRNKRHHYESIVEQAVTDGIEQGKFRSNLDPHEATLFLFGACNWSYQWLQVGDQAKARDLSARWCDMLLEGFCVTQ